MRWDAFEDACPEIAEIARERFALDQLVMLGTIRRDGSPRVSPCECDFGAGRLFVSMMWRSKKALDLLRDPRIVVHSVTSNKEGTDGDVKIYGRAIDERDPEVREAFREAIRTRMDWAPEEPDYHCFSVDVSGAGYVRFGDAARRSPGTRNAVSAGSLRLASDDDGACRRLLRAAPALAHPQAPSLTSRRRPGRDQSNWKGAGAAQQLGGGSVGGGVH